MPSACGFKFREVLYVLFVCWNIQAQGLKVTLLGTGSPIPIIDRFGPSTLVEAGTEKLLIDCGRGVTSRLWQMIADNHNSAALTHRFCYR
jgi:hypothetical protein